MSVEWNTKDDLRDIQKSLHEERAKLLRKLEAIDLKVQPIDALLGDLDTEVNQNGQPERNGQKGKPAKILHSEGSANAKLINARERCWRTYCDRIVSAMRVEPKMWRTKQEICRITGIRDSSVSPAVTWAEHLGAIERHPDDPPTKTVGARFRLREAGSIVIKPGEGIVR